jgi:hypothetical protein
MRRTEALQGVRVAMFLTIRRRWESAELNEDEAAELLGVSTRTFRRWRNRCDEHGEAGFWTSGSTRRRASGFPPPAPIVVEISGPERAVELQIGRTWGF